MKSTSGAFKFDRHQEFLPKVRTWLAQRPRYHIHYTTTTARISPLSGPRRPNPSCKRSHDFVRVFPGQHTSLERSNMANFKRILTQLRSERNHLQQELQKRDEAIRAIEAINSKARRRGGRPPRAAAVPRRRGRMSAAARRKLSQLLKMRSAQGKMKRKTKVVYSIAPLVAHALAALDCDAGVTQNLSTLSKLTSLTLRGD
jgi:hypothetical protein